MINLASFERTPLERAPYEHIVVTDFLAPQAFEEASADYPVVPGPGSHPPAVLDIKGKFKALMDELEGPAFRAAIEKKFDIDLTGRPTMYTVRGFLRRKDGSVHTDSETKLITVLLYMNPKWEEQGGRLRVLRSDNVDDYVAEIPPYGGTLLAFKRSDTSWHGHLPFEGPRRTIQLNWVTSEAVVQREQSRHLISSQIKKVTGWLTPKSGTGG
jgi:hypothetical protein